MVAIHESKKNRMKKEIRVELNEDKMLRVSKYPMGLGKRPGLCSSHVTHVKVGGPWRRKHKRKVWDEVRRASMGGKLCKDVIGDEGCM